MIKNKMVHRYKGVGKFISASNWEEVQDMIKKIYDILKKHPEKDNSEICEIILKREER